MHSADVFLNVLHFHTATLWVFREEGAVVGIWFLSVCGPSKLPCKPQTFRFHTVDGSEIRRSPVEVGSFSHYLQAFSTILGGDRRNSEPSTLSNFRRFVQICRWEKCSFIMRKDLGNLYQHHLLNSIPRIFMNPRLS